MNEVLFEQTPRGDFDVTVRNVDNGSIRLSTFTRSEKELAEQFAADQSDNQEYLQ